MALVLQSLSMCIYIYEEDAFDVDIVEIGSPHGHPVAAAWSAAPVPRAADPAASAPRDRARDGAPAPPASWTPSSSRRAPLKALSNSFQLNEQRLLVISTNIYI